MIAPVQDRRVRRSRAALLQATLTLVSQRGTAAVPLSDIAEAANVSRPVVYQHFGDRDTLLLETALDLAARELLPHITDFGHTMGERAPVLTLANHFADHRAFYRAILTSPCAFALNKSLTGLLIPINRRLIQQMFSETLPPQRLDDLATFLTGGGAAFVNTWVVEGAEPLDPEEFTDRLMGMAAVATAALRTAAAKNDKGLDR